MTKHIADKAPAALELRLAEQSGVTIEYLVQGTGPQIFILPSLGRGPADFDSVAAWLADRGYTVIRPLPRGMGRSTGPCEGISLGDLAKDIALVICQEGYRRPVVAGHAFGNFVARMLATMDSGLVRGVALLAASAGKTATGEPAISAKLMASVYGSGDASLSRDQRLKHLRHAFFAEGNDPTAWLDGWYPDVKTIQSTALAATPIDLYFAAGTVPLLDLQAEDDSIAPRRFAGFLKDSLGERVTVRVIPRAGHALIPEQPLAVGRTLDEWVRTLPPLIAFPNGAQP